MQRDAQRRYRERQGAPARPRVQFRAKHIQDVLEGRQGVEYFSVGHMNILCPFCSSLLWMTEKKSIFCQLGKVSVYRPDPARAEPA